MSREPQNGESRAHLLVERLAAVVQEHYAQEVRQEHEELERFRCEVLHLQGELLRLRGELPSPGQDLSSTRQVDTEDVKVSIGQPAPCQKVAEGDAPAEEPYLVNAAYAMEREVSPGSADCDFRTRFESLAGRKQFIEIDTIAHHVTEHLSNEDTLKEKEMQRYKIAVHKLERKLAEPLSANDGQLVTGRISFETFRFLMNEDHERVKDVLGVDVADALSDLRDALIDDVIVKEIAKSCHVMEDEVYSEDERVDKKTRIAHCLEPASALMTVLNAVVIGASLDFASSWDGWFVFETVFSAFFLFEVCVNVYARGFTDYLFGDGWYWSWFDIIVVSFAVVDTIFVSLNRLQAGSGIDMNVSVTRLFRLIKMTRVTRIIRLLRLRVFKELTLMVNGVASSLRTIFWAVVVLSVCIYVIGVFMRQVLMDPDDRFECQRKSASKAEQCSENENKMITFGPIMFGSVARSMATLFMCFTEGCTSPDGTPFMWLLWDTHGPLMVILYLSTFVFISFGVFNLIMAMVVENTIATAVQQDAERLFGQHSGHVKKARALHSLLTKYGRSNPGLTSSKSFVHPKGLKGKLHRYRQGPTSEIEEAPGERHMQLQISHDQFSAMMSDPEVIELMEDLNISYISRKQLFDILDSDASGFLSVSEVVDGIMKLRGPADKGDVVGMCLAVRQMQMQLNALEHQIKTQVPDKVPSADPSLPRGGERASIKRAGSRCSEGALQTIFEDKSSAPLQTISEDKSSAPLQIADVCLQEVLETDLGPRKMKL